MLRVVLTLAMGASVCGGEALPVARAWEGGDLTYRLARFVQWSEQGPSAGVFVVGIVGEDALAGPFKERLEHLRIAGRLVQVRSVAAPEEMRRCQMLFVGSTAGGQVRTILQRLEGAQVLTVSAIPGFGQMGGMVELVLTEPWRRPVVLNTEVARRNGIRFHAGLLPVANLTHTQQPIAARMEARSE